MIDLLSAYEKILPEWQAERSRIKKLRAHLTDIESQLDREIAALLYKQEWIDAQNRQIKRLHGLLEIADPNIESILRPSALKALQRARRQRNPSAMLALDRELRKTLEEELMLLALVA